MIRRHLDLILIVILTITVVALRLMYIEGGTVMKLTGAVFVLFAPGYAVMAAVFKEGVLEIPAKIALGIGLSMAISAVGGIGLYGIGALLTTTSWTVFLTIIVFGGSIVAIVQRSRNTSYTPNYVTRKLAFSEVLLLGFIILVLAGGIYLAQTAEKNQAYVPFTEFWLIPKTADILEIEVGLHNFEQANMVYDISVSINESEVKTWENILVQPDQEWSRTYTLPSKVASNETIVVNVYTDDNHTNPYRWGQLHR